MGWRRQQGGFNLFPLVDDHPKLMTPSSIHLKSGRVAEAYLGDEDKFPCTAEPTNTAGDRPSTSTPRRLPDIDESKLRNIRIIASLQEHADATFLMTTGARQQALPHEHRQLPWCASCGAAPGDEPERRCASGARAGRLVWIEPVGQEVRCCWICTTASAGHGEREPRVVVPEMDTASHGYELVNINCVMDRLARITGCAVQQRCARFPVLVYKGCGGKLAVRQPQCRAIRWVTVHLRCRRSAVEGMDGNGIAISR